jgi:multidrug efflux pump subunit AcrB
MSLNLSAIAVRERAVTLFFILLLMAAGAYAFVMLGRAEDPGFTIKNMTVTAAWPGATAREMQDLVAEPLEKRLQELTWYDRVETTTRPGHTYMTITLRTPLRHRPCRRSFIRLARSSAMRLATCHPVSSDLSSTTNTRT